MTPDAAKILRFIILGGVALILVLLGLFIASHRFVSFTFTSPDGAALNTVTVTGTDRRGIFHIANFYIVPVAQKTIQFTTAAKEETTLAVASLPLVSTDTPIAIHKLRQTTVFTSKSLGCNTYDASADALLTQQCDTAATGLFQLDDTTTHPWGNTEVQHLTQGIVYRSYLNGVISLTAADASDRVALIYSRAGMTHYALDDTASRQLDTDLATDATNERNAAFTTYSPSGGQLAYYTVRDQKVVSIKQASLPESKDSGAHSRCTMAGTTVYCLTGTFSSRYGHEDEATNKATASVVTTVDFSKAQPTVNSLPLSSSLHYVNDIYVDASGGLYIKNDQDLYRVADGNIALVHPSVSSAASGKSLIFTNDTGVYEVQANNTTRKLIDKEKLSLANLNVYGSTILFDTRLDNSPLFSDGIAMRIDDAPVSDTASILSAASLLAGSNLPIDSAVFSKNRLQVQPASFYTSDRVTGTFGVDQAEYAKSKAAIQDFITAQKSKGNIPAALEVSFAQ